MEFLFRFIKCTSTQGKVFHTPLKLKGALSVLFYLFPSSLGGKTGFLMMR